MEFTITADDQPANDALGRVRGGLNQLERVAVDAGRRASAALDSLTRGVVKVAEAAGAISVAKRAFGELRDAFTGIDASQRRSIVSGEKLIDTYRAVRLGLAALSGSAAALAGTGITIGLGVALEESIRLSRRFGEELRTASRDAVNAGATIQDALTLRTAGTILGADLAPFAGKVSASDLRDYISELRDIRDPFEQATRAATLFGDQAAAALQLIEQPTEQAIAASQELARSLNTETRAAVEDLRRNLAGVGGVFDAFTRNLRQLREEAAQAITVTIAVAFRDLNAGAKAGAQKLPQGFSDPGSNPDAPFGFGGVAPLTQKELQQFQKEQEQRLAQQLRQSTDLIASTANSLLTVDGNKATAVVKQYESTVDGLRERLVAAKKRRDDAFALIARGNQAERNQFGPVALSASNEVAVLEQRIKAAENVASAEKRAADILTQAKKAEFTGLADIIQEYKIYRAELGLSAKANADLSEAVTLRLRVEALKELRKNAAGAVQDIDQQKSQQSELNAKRLREEKQFQDGTLQLQTQAIEQRFRLEEDFARTDRDAQLRALEGLNAQTVAQKVAVEQQKAKVEEDFIIRTFRLRADTLDREVQNEIASVEIIARARGESEDAIQARREALLQLAAEKGKQLDETSQAQINAARENGINRSNQIIFDSNKRLFDSLRSGFESTFDGLLRGTKSAADTIKNLLAAAFLTPIKQAASSVFANLVFPFAQRLQGSLGVAGGAGGLGGGGGALSSIPGLVGIGLGGNGQLVPFPGAPGGTGGFAGPVGGQGGSGGLGGLLGIGALSGKGGLGALATSAIPAALLGGGILGGLGAFRLGQSQSGARYAAPALGAAAGVAGFAGLAAAFPTIFAGLAVGGPVGWIAAAGIGAAIGIIGLLKTSAEQKIVDKVRDIYGVKIDRSFAKDPLAGIIHQQFSGDIAVGLRSPQVRDLVTLYAMSRGESTSGIANYAPIARSFNLNGGGQFTQLPSYQNGQPVSIDRLNGSAATNAAPVVNMVQLDAAATTAFLQGQAAELIQQQPRLSQAAVIAAQRQNSGRRESLALQLQPGLLTA